MTGDLASISTLENVKKVDSETFIAAIRENLTEMLA